MSQFWSESVHQLEPYVPGEQPKVTNLIKLNTNENPYPPSAKAIAAIQAANADSLRLYPDPNSDALKQSIANYYALETKQVFVGNGSDEVLAHTFQALLKHDAPLLFPDITYSFYPVYCGLYDIHYKTIALTDTFAININDYQQPNGGIIFPNPNAPTGVGLDLKDIETLIQNNASSVVVIDEAYIDFGGESAVALVNQFPNLLVCQTLSKSRSLAGLRVGFAVGHPDLIAGLERVKNSFNSYPIDRLAEQGAIAAMADQTYFDATCHKIITSRDFLTQQLKQLGFKVLPSQANFVFTQHPTHDAEKISAYLRSQAIIVRHFKQERIAQYLRITIGRHDECVLLVQALKEYLKGS